MIKSLIKKLSKIVKILLISLPINVYADACAVDYEISRVIDGDTVEISAPFLPKPLKPFISLRISGIDTPEKGFRSKCLKEAVKAELATEFTKNLVQNAKTKLVILEKEDKYFRILGDVVLDGISLRESLLKAGFAVPYYGEKKPDWCLE